MEWSDGKVDTLEAAVQAVGLSNAYTNMQPMGPVSLDQARPPPRLVFWRQPSKEHRYRYETEGPGRGGLKARDSKSWPAVKLENYPINEETFVAASLYTKDSIQKHFHKLVMGTQTDICVESLKRDGTCTFQNLGILRCKAEDALKELSRRLYPDITVSPQMQLDLKQELKKIDLNFVTIQFQAYQTNSNNPIGSPVYSDPIFNSKSPPRIHRISKNYSDCFGNEEVFLLCDEVKKKDIQVRFFEKNANNEEIWAANGYFTNADVHKQVAIVLRTPPYRFNNISKEVKVYMQLVRKEGGEENSEPLEFFYKPHDPDPHKMQEKEVKGLPENFDLGLTLEDITDVLNTDPSSFADLLTEHWPQQPLPDAATSAITLQNYASTSNGYYSTMESQVPQSATFNTAFGSQAQQHMQPHQYPQSGPLPNMNFFQPQASAAQMNIQYSGAQLLGPDNYPFLNSASSFQSGREGYASSVCSPYSSSDGNNLSVLGSSDYEFDTCIPMGTKSFVDTTEILKDNTKSLDEPSSLGAELDGDCISPIKRINRLGGEQLTERTKDLLDEPAEKIKLFQSQASLVEDEDCKSISQTIEELSALRVCEEEPNIIDNFSATSANGVNYNHSETLVQKTEEIKVEAEDKKVSNLEKLEKEEKLKEDYVTPNLESKPARTKKPVKTTPGKTFKRLVSQYMAPLYGDLARQFTTTADVQILIRAMMPFMACKNKDGDNALHLAVIHQRANSSLFDQLMPVLKLLRPYDTINKTNNLLQSPLHLAVLAGDEDVVERLLSSGANPNIRDKMGNSPVHLSVIQNNTACLSLLVKRTGTKPRGTLLPRPELDMVNYQGKSPLHLAVDLVSCKSVSLLVEAGADVNIGDATSGRRPLHTAVEMASPLVELLLKQDSIEVDAEDFAGQIPLQLACLMNSLEMALVLKEAGACPLLNKYVFGETPLSIASGNLKLESILRGTLLLEEKSSILALREKAVKDWYNNTTSPVKVGRGPNAELERHSLD